MTNTTSSYQLSQRDCAAGWVTYRQKWKILTVDNIYGHYRSVSGAVLEENIGGKTKKLTTFLVVALKTQANQINHSNPPKNAPCITVCWFYYCILPL